jgi:hypothetical protein
MKISTISTYTDWANLHGTDGYLGTERLMDWLKVAHIDTLYVRAFNGGQATYPSKVATPQVGRESNLWKIGEGGGVISRKFYQHVDFSRVDQLEMAVKLGRARGISVHAWFTLCEEDHGGGHMSAFGAKTHLRKTDRDGRSYEGTADFFFPEVQKYKLALVDEMLERDIDGILLDFVRCNATPNGDPDGYNRFGYNPEIRAAFKSEHGADPLDLSKSDKRWLSFKRAYVSDFVRKIKSKLGKKPVSIMAIPDVDNANWLCLDLPNLTRDGTVSHVMAFGMSYNPSPKRVAQDFKNLRRQVKGKATVAAGTQSYDNDPVDPEALEAAIAGAKDAGAKQFVIYEADSLVGERFLTSVRAIHLGAERRSRDIAVASIAGKPKPADWKKARLHSGFFTAIGPDRERPAGKTSFCVLRGPKSLFFRIIAEGEQGEIDAGFARAKKVYIDWLGEKHWSLTDRAHVFLDPAAGRRDFAHFIVTRQGKTLQGKRADSEWTCKWTGAAQQLSPRRWEALFEIPFAALGNAPKKGDRWGFQIIREQATEKEASSWFVSTGRRYSTPQHWGDLIFA